MADQPQAVPKAKAKKPTLPRKPRPPKDMDDYSAVGRYLAALDRNAAARERVLTEAALADKTDEEVKAGMAEEVLKVRAAPASPHPASTPAYRPAQAVMNVKTPPKLAHPHPRKRTRPS